MENIINNMTPYCKNRSKTRKIAHISIFTLILSIFLSSIMMWWNEPIYAIWTPEAEARIKQLEEIARTPEKNTQEWWTMYCNDLPDKCK